MNLQTQILQRLNQLTASFNNIITNSKRIDELPAATSGNKYVAVWNEAANGGNGQTQKQSRDTFVNQNNQGQKIGIGNFTDPVNNPIAEAVIKVNTLYGVNVTETQTPIILYGVRYLPPPGGGSTLIPVYKYGFIFLAGKGNWGLGGTPINANMLYPITPENIQPGDISPTGDTEIIALGDIGSESNFLPQVNSIVRDFSDADFTHYFSYYADDVLYITLFIGTPGVYGDTEPHFEEDDFANITNSDVEPGPALQTYDSVLEQNNVTGREAIHRLSGKELRYGNQNIDYSENEFHTTIDFETPTANEKVTFRNKTGVVALLSDITQGSGINYNEIKKVGKGFHYEGGDIVANMGTFEEDEAGDIFKAILVTGESVSYMRYKGSGSTSNIGNFYYDAADTAWMPGEPNYIDPGV